MKKILLLVLFISVFCFSAKAVDSTGCGLGSTVWKGQSGMLPQLMAVTTNGTSANQTFGITSGTSGCDPNGRITGGTGKILAFLEKNMDSFAIDVAKGEGETLNTLAQISNKDVNEIKKIVQDNFDYLFDEDTHVAVLSIKLAELLNIA